MGFCITSCSLEQRWELQKGKSVAVIGDGGYQMTIQELGTIFQTGSAVKNCGVK